MGWFGGLGPFKGMKDVRMGKHPGNAPEYDFDKISALENSPLAGKQVCILGSSVVYGSASGENAVGEYLSARLGFDLTKEAVSGTTLVDIGEKSYISRLKNRIDQFLQGKKKFRDCLLPLQRRERTVSRRGALRWSCFAQTACLT